MKRSIYAAGVLFALAAPAAAQDDGVTMQCLDAGHSADICVCATIAMAETVDGDDLAVFAGYGEALQRLRQNGAGSLASVEGSINDTATLFEMEADAVRATRDAVAVLQAEAVLACVEAAETEAAQDG